MNSGIGILRELADTLEEEAKQVAEMEAELSRLRSVNAELERKVNDIAGDAAKNLVDATVQEDENKRLRAANEELVEALKKIARGVDCPEGIIKRPDFYASQDYFEHIAIDALSRAEQKPETCVDVEKIDTAIAEALGEAYDCTRVWESWGYGAMRSDDFVRVSDDPGRIMEIRDAVLKAMGTPEQEAKPETCVWKYEEAWVSGCGLQYINAVIDADMKFCPFCGKKVEVKK